MSWLKRTLLEHSTQRYCIEYDRFLSNHLPHGIIALTRLGAPEARVKQFINWYTDRLQEPLHPEESQHNILDERELEPLIGKRQSFYGLLGHYEKTLNQYGCLDTLVRKEFPKLSRGIIGSALHGLVHLGYGYAAENGRLVCEGLAYLHHSHNPLVFDRNLKENDIGKFGKGHTSIIDVLSEIKADKKLRESMINKAVEYSKSDWFSSNFQYRAAALMTQGDELLAYANKIKVPTLNEEDGKTTAVKTADWIIEQALSVYTLSERKNDFFLIHGVTAAWSLRQIIPCLAPEDALDVLRTYVCVLLTAYVVQESPGLSGTIDIDAKTVDENTWTRIIEEVLSRDTDEHIYKLIQVAHDLWCENKQSDSAALYVAAAKSALDNTLVFIDYGK